MNRHCHPKPGRSRLRPGRLGRGGAPYVISPSGPGVLHSDCGPTHSAVNVRPTSAGDVARHSDRLFRRASVDCKFLQIVDCNFPQRLL